MIEVSNNCFKQFEIIILFPPSKNQEASDRNKNVRAGQFEKKIVQNIEKKKTKSIHDTLYF